MLDITNKTIELIAKQIKNHPVILYPCCSETLFIVAKLKQLYGLSPTAICDKNSELSSNHYHQLAGIDILTIEDALTKYPLLKIFVSHSRLRFDIFDYLIEEKSISSAIIINYEPYEKRLSCMDLECNLVLMNSSINLCCDGDSIHLPSVEFSGDYPKVVASSFELKERLITNAPGGVCANCSKLRIGNYPIERRVRTINHSSGGRCNLDCDYCSSAARHTAKAIPDGIDYEKLIECIPHDTPIATSLACGEITLHPDKEHIISAASKIGFVNFFTNATVYDVQIQRILDCGNGHLAVSLDSGTRETYHKVKGVDLCEKVTDNLRKYSSRFNNTAVLHYIFIPDVNDSVADMQGFTDLATEIGAICVYISNDFNDKTDFPESSKDNINRFIEMLTQIGLKPMLSTKVREAVL